MHDSQSDDVYANKLKELQSVKWMIRSCDVYEDEYSNCTSIKSRFHQYFIHGDLVDCNPWKLDHQNCLKWKDKPDDVQIFEQLITSEEKRRQDRLGPHYANDIWKKRKEPPSDWNKPLPDWLMERNQATYLGIKAEEMRTNVDGLPSNNRSLCVIS